MATSRYSTPRAATPVPRTMSRPAGNRSTELVRAVQAVAGNAVVSRALQATDAQDGRRRPRSEAVGQSLDPVKLHPPSFDLAIGTRAFRELLDGSHVTSPRAIATTLEGRGGRSPVDWTAGTGAHTRELASFACRRRTAIFQGALEAFPGVAWNPADSDQTSGSVDLRRMAPGRGSLTGSLRIRMGRRDLVRGAASVDVVSDGHGSLRLSLRMPDATLTMTTLPPTPGDRAPCWQYALELPTRQLAAGVWDGLPRRVRWGGPSRSASPDADGPPDDPSRRGTSRDRSTGSPTRPPGTDEAKP